MAVFSPMSKYQRVRGTQDLLPEASLLYRYVEKTAFDLAKVYGHGEIKTPMFEFSEVFHRSLGETSDVVSKETYSFEDRSGEALTLRPEGTAGVARAFVSEGMAQNLPLKFYYAGAMFRYERPQKGRYRQFHQIGIESLGFENPESDVECLAYAWHLLQNLGLSEKCTLEINTLGDQESRAHYRDELKKYFSDHQDKLSADSKVRLEKNPLRILDSKDEADRALVAQAPLMQNFLNENSQKFFADVLAGLDRLKIPYKVNPKLVRGLDYYTHTVFEFITSELGAQGTVLGGGRYDGLVELMGGNRTPGVGWAAGVERLSELVDKTRVAFTDPLICLVPADEAGEKACTEIAYSLRTKNLRVENLFGSGNVGKKMKRANKLQATYALIIGSTELERKVVALKNLTTGEQTEVPLAELPEYKF